MSQSQKKRVRKALGNKNLHSALEKAASLHFTRFNSLKNEVAWEELKKKARAIREECLKRLPELIQRFKQEAEKSGAHVHLADTPEQALAQIKKILKEKKARLVVKSKSMVSEEIGLNSYLKKEGCRVVETDLGEWIIQLAGERPSHITGPALHKTKEDVAELLSRHLGREVPADAQEITKIARQEMRRFFVEADVGISGANLAVAESGTLVIVSNEGNARLVTSLPPVHIALITVEKFVETFEQAATLIKTLTAAATGQKLTAYVSFITGPSRTMDIEKELVIGAHGPQEVQIIILDNGRLKFSQEQDLDQILYCLKCGGCLLVCPIFQALGGHVYGGPVYPGGLGLLFTAITRSFEQALPLLDLCSDCKKCEEFCPVGIPTGELLLLLKARKKPRLRERLLSWLFRERALVEKAARPLLGLQKLWQKHGQLREIPLSWAKGKSLPLLHLEKSDSPEETGGEKIYLFEGCVGKFFFPEIRRSVTSYLSSFGFSVVCPASQACCGAPSLHLGLQQDVEKMAFQNLESFERENPDFILTICPTGNSMLKKTYPRFNPKARRWVDKIYDFSAFLVQKQLKSPEKRTLDKKEVFYHYPCHYLNSLRLHEEPQKTLEAAGYNPREEAEPFACCGFCGLFSLKNPEISAHLWEKKKKKILESKIRLVATDCPGCLFQMRASLPRGKAGFMVFHTAELVAQATKEKTSSLQG